MYFSSSLSGFTKGKAVELEDIKFHQCVRLAQFEADRVINFIPPDGEFVLMSYRLNTHVRGMWPHPSLILIISSSLLFIRLNR